LWLDILLLISLNIFLSKNDLIVDLGCGPGNISEKLSERWPDVNVLGVDGSQEMIREAESRLFKNKIVNKYRNLNFSNILQNH